jgi:cytidylate kinase
MKTSSELLGEAFTRAPHRWRRTSAGKPELPPAPLRLEYFTVAISRQASCGGEAIAREIGALLGWPVYDRELLERSKTDMLGSAEYLQELDERPPSWFSDVLRGLTGHTDEKRKLARDVFKMIAVLGDHGGGVIVGRGATFLLPPARTLRVRLTAPLQVRVKHFQNERGVSLSDAEREITRIDQERAAFIKAYFQKDNGDLDHYDVALNTARFTAKAAAEVIATALKQLHAQAKNAPQEA